MSLMLVGAEEELPGKIRSRMAEGAAIQEVALDEVPEWFAARIAGHSVRAVFQSRHGAVACLADGGSIVSRAPGR